MISAHGTVAANQYLEATPHDRASGGTSRGLLPVSQGDSLQYNKNMTLRSVQHEVLRSHPHKLLNFAFCLAPSWDSKVSRGVKVYGSMESASTHRAAVVLRTGLSFNCSQKCRGSLAMSLQKAGAMHVSDGCAEQNAPQHPSKTGTTCREKWKWSCPPQSDLKLDVTLWYLP